MNIMYKKMLSAAVTYAGILSLSSLIAFGEVLLTTKLLRKKKGDKKNE